MTGYGGEGFRHHKPYFVGNGDSLREAMQADAARNPEKVLTIPRVMQEGDEVAVLSHVQQHLHYRGLKWIPSVKTGSAQV